MDEQVGAVGARVQQVSNRSQSVQVLEGDHNALSEELIRLRQQNRDQFDAIKSIYASLDQIRNTSTTRNANLEQQINNLRSLVVSQLQLNR